jgi:hypothetical protein
METTVNNGITYTYKQSEIDSKICDTIDLIEKFVKENNYQVIGDIEQYYALEWKNFSKTEMKKIQKYCFWIERRPTLRNINTFLGLLSRLFKVERVKIKISLKEEKIQKARKEWLKARNEADRLLDIYKLEKGNFYKK